MDNRSQNCPSCWDNKHECLRDIGKSACGACKSYNNKRRNQGLGIDLAPPFHATGGHRQLYQNVNIGSLPFLDIQRGSGELNRCRARATSTTGRSSQLHLVDIYAEFTTNNEQVVAALDSLAMDTLSSPLRDKYQDCNAVHMASLFCGYAHLLCSTTNVTEEVKFTLDANAPITEQVWYNLHVHFQVFIFSRLCQLRRILLEYIRLEESIEHTPQHMLSAYASATILRYSAFYFGRSLRNGKLSKLRHLPDDFQKTLISFFEAIDNELTQRLREDCGKYPNWRDTFVGSLKRFRRKHETLTLDLTLHQFKFTQQSNHDHGLVGDGNVYLLLPQSSPMLQMPGLSYDFPGGMEQLPSHVLDPLSFDDTWQETSVLDVRDPFLNFDNFSYV